MVLLFAMGLLPWMTGCEGRRSFPRRRPAKGTRVVGSKVTRIVFIGKKNACQCTRRQIEKSWADLQAALKGRNIPVQKIYWDVDEAEVNKYRKIEQFMTLPAVYFLDKDGRIVEMLQGEMDMTLAKAALAQKKRKEQEAK